MTPVICLSLLMRLHHPLPRQRDFTFQAFYVTIERMALFLVKVPVLVRKEAVQSRDPFQGLLKSYA